MSSRRILITGGCGFIGSRLVDHAVRAGDRVAVLDDLSLGSRASLDPEIAAEVDVWPSDVRVTDQVRATIEGARPEAIVHLAALHFIPACDRDPVLAIELNVAGAQSLLSACEASRSEAGVVLASSAAVYAPSLAAHDERSPLGPTDIYGLTKLWAEQLVSRARQRAEIPAAVARLFNVFGPGETNPHLIPSVIGQALETDSLQLGDLSTARDYVFVDDVVRALLSMVAALPGCDGLVCNIGSERSVTGEEIVAAVGSELGRDLDVERDAERLRRSDRPVMISDCSLAAERLGWRAETGLREGIARALDRPLAVGVKLG